MDSPTTATVQVLVALYAIHHRIGLTSGDVEALQASGLSASPDAWREAVALLAETDRVRVDVDPGWTAAVTRWLGMDEAVFFLTHGLEPGEALARSPGELGTLARLLEEPGTWVLDGWRCAVASAWCVRAELLLKTLPETATAAVEVLQQAKAHAPPHPKWHRDLDAALDVARAATADEEGRHRVVVEASVTDPHLVPGAAVGRLLCCLWAMEHEEHLLPSERGLDPEVRRSDLWRTVRSAVEAGRWRDVPRPVETFVAWAASVRRVHAGSTRVRSWSVSRQSAACWCRWCARRRRSGAVSSPRRRS